MMNLPKENKPNKKQERNNDEWGERLLELEAGLVEIF